MPTSHEFICQRLRVNGGQVSSYVFSWSSPIINVAIHTNQGHPAKCVFLNHRPAMLRNANRRQRHGDGNTRMGFQVPERPGFSYNKAFSCTVLAHDFKCNRATWCSALIVQYANPCFQGRSNPGIVQLVASRHTRPMTHKPTQRSCQISLVMRMVHCQCFLC